MLNCNFLFSFRRSRSIQRILHTRFININKDANSIEFKYRKSMNVSAAIFTNNRQITTSVRLVQEVIQPPSSQVPSASRLPQEWENDRPWERDWK